MEILKRSDFTRGEKRVTWNAEDLKRTREIANTNILLPRLANPEEDFDREVGKLLERLQTDLERDIRVRTEREGE